MKEFKIFVCTDSTEIFFSKLGSAGLNFNLSSFFTDSLLCVGYLISLVVVVVVVRFPAKDGSTASAEWIQCL